MSADTVITGCFCLQMNQFAFIIQFSGIKHQPPQQLSLCTKGYSKETKVSLLPHVNCTCRLVIPIQNRIRIIAKQDPEQSGSSENEAFVIAQESFRYTPTLYKTGSCQEYGSSTQHLSYTISYIQQVKKTKTNLQLWLEGLYEVNFAISFSFTDSSYKNKSQHY